MNRHSLFPSATMRHAAERALPATVLCPARRANLYPRCTRLFANKIQRLVANDVDNKRVRRPVLLSFKMTPSPSLIRNIATIPAPRGLVLPSNLKWLKRLWTHQDYAHLHAVTSALLILNIVALEATNVHHMAQGNPPWFPSHWIEFYPYFALNLVSNISGIALAMRFRRGVARSIFVTTALGNITGIIFQWWLMIGWFPDVWRTHEFESVCAVTFVVLAVITALGSDPKAAIEGRREKRAWKVMQKGGPGQGKPEQGGLVGTAAAADTASATAGANMPTAAAAMSPSIPSSTTGNLTAATAALFTTAAVNATPTAAAANATPTAASGPEQATSVTSPLSLSPEAFTEAANANATVQAQEGDILTAVTPEVAPDVLVEAVDEEPGAAPAAAAAAPWYDWFGYLFPVLYGIPLVWQSAKLMLVGGTPWLEQMTAVNPEMVAVSFHLITLATLNAGLGLFAVTLRDRALISRRTELLIISGSTVPTFVGYLWAAYDHSNWLPLMLTDIFSNPLALQGLPHPGF